MLDSSTKGPCPLGWIEHNGNCYFFSETVANFTTAEIRSGLTKSNKGIYSPSTVFDHLKIFKE
uniref:Uncharacterized protein n=1 Tax=Magallana gigas TaxID=29159 RepID=K1QLE5_MAGGI